MDQARRSRRIDTEIVVTVSGVLESHEATIANLTGDGALIAGASFPKGSKLQIDYMGEIVFAQCVWSEIDRMGVYFPFGLGRGPLYDALMLAAHGQDETPSPESAPMPSSAFSRVSGPVSFGKRL
jgi:hypothetical protein